MFLGPRRSGDAYYAKDLSFIESLLELASVALENSLLYRQRIHMLEYSTRLLESLNSGVIAVDVNGRITSFNPSCLTLLGLDGAKPGLLLDILPSEVGWALALAIAGPWHAKDVEVSIDRGSRGVLPILLSTAVLRDHSNSTVTGALAVITDLSTVKALERHQRRIEHLATMARFYAGIAHEIRSPLAAISNFVSMLADRFDDPEYRETAARLLPLEVSRIVRLADRLRLMAPSEDGRLREVSLSPLLADIIAIHTPTAAESGVRLLLDCPEGLPNIHADPGQLVQLFVNLLRNAVESMPDGGEVLLRCIPDPHRANVAVEIIDEGTGIDPSIRSQLFQPFFTTKSLGTGLGLAICREIADFHRAQLTLLPRSDRSGTIARVRFASTIVDSSSAHPRHHNTDMHTSSS